MSDYEFMLWAFPISLIAMIISLIVGIVVVSRENKELNLNI